MLYAYNIVLMALFMLGLLADDGFGWAFVPLLICTAPWSFFAPTVLLHGALGNWFMSGLIGNFVLYVVLCGGINDALLYLLLRKALYPTDASAKPGAPRSRPSLGR